MSRNLILISGETDPFFNLALEEFLVRERVHLGLGRVLLLYRNTRAVVIGRNQNPWMECAVERLAADGVPVVRRISGGGAVYHDLGNGNIALVGPRRGYRPARHVELLRHVLGTLGISVEPDERHALFLAGRKISGSAFMLSGRSALQHSTLLIDADLAGLEQGLRGGLSGVRTRAQRSHRSPVRNLRDVAPSLDWQVLCAALVHGFQAEFDPGAKVETWGRAEIGQAPAFLAYRARHESWEWRFGRTPEFRLERLVPLEHGPPAHLVLCVRHGVIAEAGIAQDTARADPSIPAALDMVRGCQFRSAAFRERRAGAGQSAPAGAVREFLARLEGSLFGATGTGD